MLTRSSGMCLCGFLCLLLAILQGIESSTRERLEIGRAGCRHFHSKLGFSSSALERLTLGTTRTSPLISAVLPLRALRTFFNWPPDKGKKDLLSIFEASTEQKPWPVPLDIEGVKPKTTM